MPEPQQNSLKVVSSEPLPGEGAAASAPTAAPELKVVDSQPLGQPQSAKDTYNNSGALYRFGTSATETTPLSFLAGKSPSEWPKAFSDFMAQMSKGPIPSNSLTGPIGNNLNIGYNLVKGMVKSSGEASGEGIDQLLHKPGWQNKLAGATRTVVGGLPMIGPILVKAMDQADAHDFAGMSGTLAGLGLQDLMAAHPESVGRGLNATGQYLFSKPRVQETVLADEAKTMLTNSEANARQAAHDKFPEESQEPVPGHQVSGIAQKALDDNIRGAQTEPTPMKPVLGNSGFKRLGAIEGPGGGLQDIYSRMADETPVMPKDIQGYVTELGSYMSRGKLPGDVYAAVKQTREGLVNLLDQQYNAEGKGPAWEDARANWRRVAKEWWDPSSPLYKSMQEQTPTAILKPLLGDNSEIAQKYLENNLAHGADPRIVGASQRFYNGLDQMQFRGLYRAAGPLLLGTYMLRAEGVPYSASMAMLAPVILGKMGLGWFRTRPSLTEIFSGEPPRLPGEGWTPKVSPYGGQVTLPPGWDSSGGGSTPTGPSAPESKAPAPEAPAASSAPSPVTVGPRQAAIAQADIGSKNPEWTLQQFSSEISRLNSVLRNPSVTPEEAQVAHSQLSNLKDMLHQSQASAATPADHIKSITASRVLAGEEPAAAQTRAQELVSMGSGEHKGAVELHSGDDLIDVLRSTNVNPTIPSALRADISDEIQRADQDYGGQSLQEPTGLGSQGAAGVEPLLHSEGPNGPGLSDSGASSLRGSDQVSLDAQVPGAEGVEHGPEDSGSPQRPPGRTGPAPQRSTDVGGGEPPGPAGLEPGSPVAAGARELGPGATITDKLSKMMLEMADPKTPRPRLQALRGEYVALAKQAIESGFTVDSLNESVLAKARAMRLEQLRKSSGRQ